MGEDHGRLRVDWPEDHGGCELGMGESVRLLRVGWP